MTSSLASRVNKLVEKSSYIDCGSTIRIVDDSTPEISAQIDAAKQKAEAEGRPVIERWVVDDTGKTTTRHDVRILRWRTI